MQSHHDDYKDSFYLRIMRSTIGTALRNEFAVDEDVPERIAELLKELDETDDDGPSDDFNKKTSRD
jgi:hypothetical protein